MSNPADGSPALPGNDKEPVLAPLPPDAPWWARWIEANAREAWKWASMRWSAVCVVLAEVYAMYPKETADAVKSLLPEKWWPHVIALAFLANMVFRVVKLKGDSKP
jgi:hypothetical protein